MRWLIPLVMTAAACSAAKSSPTTPAVVLTSHLHAINVLDAASVAGVSVTGPELTGGTTDASGGVSIASTTSATFAIDVADSRYVTRNTLVRVPGAEATVSLIPSSFNLTAFNEMYRRDRLQRWTSQPALRIVSNVLDFTSTSDTDFRTTATAEALTPAEIQSVIDDLAYGLPLLTAGTYASFATISTIPVATGDDVTMLVEGSITFARCRGLTAARNSSGLGQWSYRTDDSIAAGMLCVDRDFELSNSSVGGGVRLHELGHALGAQHVTSLDHVLMNPVISVNDVTDWDRSAARIAFQRPPGNRAPDQDPSSFSTNRVGQRVMTVDGCRVRQP